MPIWVRVRIRMPRTSDEMETSAKLNTGFTIGPFPFIRLPKALAERLGFDISRARPLHGVLDAAGRSLPMFELGVVEVKVVEPDRESEWVRAVAVYTGASSVLLNDFLIEELGIEPVRPGSGFWRFRGEPPGRLRKSAEPEYWRD